MSKIRVCSKLSSTFYDRTLPEEATIVGYGALIRAYDLKVLLPERLAAIIVN